MNIYIPASVEELYDKLSILRVKLSKNKFPDKRYFLLQDYASLIEITKEIEGELDTNDMINIRSLETKLLEINLELWDKKQDILSLVTKIEEYKSMNGAARSSREKLVWAVFDAEKLKEKKDLVKTEISKIFDFGDID